jgi:hypothetical protein
MRAVLTATLALGCAAGVALAQTTTPAPRAPATPQPSAAPAPSRPAANHSLTTCLAMWEASTHMSKREWTRACQRVDDRLRNLMK